MDSEKEQERVSTVLGLIIRLPFRVLRRHATVRRTMLTTTTMSGSIATSTSVGGLILFLHGTATSIPTRFAIVTSIVMSTLITMADRLRL